ncbi:MAG: exosortase/archaeosortase family protein, partial [Rhodothermia bacterium]
MFEDLRNRPDQLIPLVILMGLVLIVLWSYWNTLTWVAGFWEDPLYSHGWLVPLFTLVLLWIRGKPVDPVTLGASWFIGLTFFVVGLGMRLAAWQYGMETLGTISWAFAIPGLFLLVLIFMFRRDQFEPATMDGRWCGLALIGASLGLRLLATHYSMETIDSYSLVPAIAGVFLLVGGWQLIRWAGPPILFLVFMFPLPSVLKTSILGRLQGWATGASTYALQTLGIAAIRDGNRISIGDLELGVVDACAGLRMTTIFFALAVAIALVAKRPWWDRLIILISAIPIALTVNIVRVTVTGMLYMTAGD